MGDADGKLRPPGRASVVRAIAVAMLLLLLPAAVHAAQAVTVPVEPIRLSPHCWYVRGAAAQPSVENQGFTANAGFVVTGDGVVVFDALGTPPLGEALVRAIRTVTDQPIRRVVVSHYHSDHFYGLQALKAEGAEVWAHAGVRPYLESDAPALRLQERRGSLAPWVDDSARIVWPDVWVQDDASFELGGVTFRLHHVGPAHTPEDLALVVQEDGVFFAGDLMFGGRIPFVGEADSRAWLDAIDRVEKHQPKVLVGGHGDASANAGADLRLTRDYLLYLREQMGAAVQEFVPFEEAYAATDWSRFSHLPAFEAANRRNAYNTYLLMEREALAR